jgi:hypothetical protein
VGGDSLYVFHTHPILSYVISALVLVGIIGAGAWWYFRIGIYRTVKEKMAQCMPAWAAQGPFNDGADSSQAMASAIILTFGQDEGKKYLHSIPGHKKSYDERPEEWNKTRMLALEQGDTDSILLGRQLLSNELFHSGMIFSNSDKIIGILDKIKTIDVLLVNRGHPFEKSIEEKAIEHAMEEWIAFNETNQQGAPQTVATRLSSLIENEITAEKFSEYRKRRQTEREND